MKNSATKNSFSPAIQQLDLNGVLARLQQDHPTLDIQQAETEYRQFLQLCLEATEATVPTELADKVWHYHILDTQKYAADCNTLFGKFIHHTPNQKPAAIFEKAAAQSRRIWADRFGGQAGQIISAFCDR